MIDPDHPPAYVLQIKRHWQNLVSVRGKLTPRICLVGSPSCASAEAWFHAGDGQRTVDANQGDRFLLV